MSLVASNKHISNWANCPPDILLIIFAKLNLKSLANSMYVNKYWRDVVEYYCQHFNIWDKMMEQLTDNKGLSFCQKSTLSCRDIIHCARRWNNIKNATVHFHHRYQFGVVKSICVYKDNLIVATNDGIEYFAHEHFIRKEIVDTICLKYEETSSLTAKLSLINVADERDGVTSSRELTLGNKLHKENCDCGVRKATRRKVTIDDISLFTVYSDRCYVIDVSNVLWRYKAEKCDWDIEMMARYYSNRDSICGLHVHEGKVFVLSKSGDVFCVDMEWHRFYKVYEFYSSMQYLDTKPYMFGMFSVLRPVSSQNVFQILPQQGLYQIVADCPRLTCATEHGHVLILGYDDGKIEIFLTNSLYKNVKIPELRFYIQNYSETSVNRITALDVYEDNDAHHLFVTTERDVHELLLCDT